jgi:hypothetical protein
MKLAFKDDFKTEIENIEIWIGEIQGSLDYINEYGYVCFSDGYYDKEKYVKMRDKLNSISNILQNCSNEMDNVCNVVKNQFEY